MQRKPLAYKIFLLIFLISTIYIGDIIFFPQRPIVSEYRITVLKNQNLNQLAEQLKTDRAIKSVFAFKVLLRILGKDKKVSAGIYIMKHPMSLWGLIFRITNNKPDQISITLMEGWTFAQVKAYIDQIDDIKHDTIHKTAKEIKNILKIDAPNLEGIFYPDTYFIIPMQTDLEIYQQAYRTMQSKLGNVFLSRKIVNTIKTPYQLLILASLIQKETSIPEDMFLVSTVFNNRLRVGMKLQDDPAVFYGLGNPERVVRQDFRVNTPYNTYLHTGLPPTPICIPSYHALIAAANPLDNKNVFYFIAVGGGRTKFSSNYKEHMNAVNKYIKK